MKGKYNGTLSIDDIFDGVNPLNMKGKYNTTLDLSNFNTV